MIVNLIEEGISLAPISRASGIPVERLVALNVDRSTPVATAEELSGYSARLALRAIQEGMRLLDEGDMATKVRLITSISGFPLRRMQTDQGAAIETMRDLFADIMTGGATTVDDPAEDDVTEDAPKTS
jgi:LDH2 family malate/lactate/ureidoglycolate dehydrogenase